MSPLLRKRDCGGDTSTCGLTTLYTRNLSPRWTKTTSSQSLFFLSPSRDTRETRNARDWRREMREVRNTRDAFFFSRCHPRFLDARACTCTPLTKSEEKERLLTVQGGQKAWQLSAKLYKALNVFIHFKVKGHKPRVWPFAIDRFKRRTSHVPNLI